MGWAAGFQAGSKLAQDALDTYYATKERNALEGIMAEKPVESQGYTAAQGEQLDAIAKAINPETGRPYYQVGLDAAGKYTVTPDFTTNQIPAEGLTQGPVSAGVMPQRVADYGGQRYNVEELTPDRIRGLQMQRMAGVIAQRDPAEAMRMQQQAADMEYQAQRRPLELEGLRQQRRLGEYQLSDAERKDAEAKKLDQFYTAVAQRQAEAKAQGRQFTVKDSFALANELGLSASQQYDIVSKTTGMDKALFEQGARDLQRLVQGKGYAELLRLHKASDMLDPNSYYRESRDPKSGRITLQLVSNDGKPLAPAQSFRSEQDAAGFLSKSATDPAGVSEWTMNMEKTYSEIDKNKASAAKELSMSAYYRDRSSEEASKNKSMSPATVKSLNDLSSQISAAEDAGDAKKAATLRGQWERAYAAGMSEINKVAQPRAPGLTRAMDDFESGQLKAFNKWLESDAGSRATPAQRDAMAQSYGVLGLLQQRGGVAGGPPGGGSITEEEVAKASKPGAAAPAATAPATGLQPPAPKEQSRRQYDLYNKAAQTNYKVIGPAGVDDLILEDPKGGRVLASKVLE